MFSSLMQPSKSPRYYRNDKLNISDIKGAQPMINQKQKLIKSRNIMDITDIMKDDRQQKSGQIIDKNDELLKDEVIGKKKQYNKYSNPLDP